MRLSRPLLIAAAAGLVASLALELALIDHDHAHAPVPYGDVPGFWAAFGLVWCIGIVLVSQWLGHGFLMRHHDPYTGEEIGEGSHGSERHE